MSAAIHQRIRRGLTVVEVAQELGVSERKIWAMISMGELPAIRHGRKCTRIMREDLDEYIEKLRGK